MATRGQLCAAIKDANIVQSKEASLEEVLAEAVFAVHPPAEVQH